MDLATFGAILSFALDLEERTSAFYKGAAKGELEEVFTDLGRSSDKRASRMERSRREGVAEMILEPISGLDSKEYEVDLPSGSSTADLLAHAITFEETALRFYRDAALKIPIREVVRVFQHMADENEKRIERLQTLKI
jgi:rubrerythrin